MILAHCIAPRLRQKRSLAACLGAAAALGFAGCASTPLPVTSNPPGASAYIGGKMVGTTPTQVTLEDTKNPTDVEFRLPGYFTESFTLPAGTTQTQISATLEPTT